MLIKRQEYETARKCKDLKEYIQVISLFSPEAKKILKSNNVVRIDHINGDIELKSMEVS